MGIRSVGLVVGHLHGREKLVAGSGEPLEFGKGKRVSVLEAVPLRGTGIHCAGLGAGHLHSKEKLVAAEPGEPLHSGKGKQAFGPGAALLPDMVRPASGGYWGQNMVTPLRGLHLGTEVAGNGLACHAHVLRAILALRSARVCAVLSRDGQRPFPHVCDACPPHVAYRDSSCQCRDKWIPNINLPFSLTFMFAITV